MESLTLKQLKEIFRKENLITDNEDTVFKGLQILSKYTKKVITASHYKLIHSANIEDVFEYISKEDALELRRFNWFIDCECFATFI